MKRLILFVSMFVLLLAMSVQGQSWTFMATESEITTVTGKDSFWNAEIGTDGNGLFVFVCRRNEDTLLLLDPDGSPKIQILASQQNMVDAINAANGDHADVTEVSIQAVDFNANGKVIVYSDAGDPEQAAVMALEPTVPTTFNVLSCAVGSGGNSPVEGGNGMVVNGNTVCLLVEGGYGASEDAILSLDSSTLVNDGSATVSTLIGESDLMTAAGETSNSDYRHNDAVMKDSNTMIVLNAGSNSSNDNLIQIDLSGGTPSASLYVDSSDIVSDLGGTVSDIGPEAMGIDSIGEVYLTNRYGDGEAQNGVLILQNISPPNCDATYDSESTIAGDLGGTSTQYFTGDTLVYDPVGNRMFLSCGGTGTNGVVYKDMTTIVEDWNLY